MGERWYLKVEGIDGESTVRGFEQWIEADAYSWEVTASLAGPGRGGARRGRATLANLLVTAPISAASPKLIAACVTGQMIPSVVLSAVRDGGDGRAADVFLSYELDDATIVAVRHADDAATVPTERLEFAYATIRVTYTPQDPGGGSGQPVTTEHSLLTR